MVIGFIIVMLGLTIIGASALKKREDDNED